MSDKLITDLKEAYAQVYLNEQELFYNFTKEILVSEGYSDTDEEIRELMLDEGWKSIWKGLSKGWTRRGAYSAAQTALRKTKRNLRKKVAGVTQSSVDKAEDAVKAAKKINAKETVLYRNEVLRLEIVEHSEPVLFQEAEYDGRKVKLNKIMRGDTKKFKVYVNSGKKNADGTIKVKKVSFGQKGMKIKKNNPKRRKSFRARHNCDNPGPKTKARYWSCRKW